MHLTHRSCRYIYCSCVAELTGLGVGGGDLLGDSGHPTGLDCPAGVVECGCRGDAVRACRSGLDEPVFTNPSNGVTLISVEQAGSSYGWNSGGKYGWQQVYRDTAQCNKHCSLYFLSEYGCTSAVVISLRISLE